jgi:hypothetical protein
MSSETRGYLGSAVYGVLIFVGVAAFGFVVAPALGIACGLFPIEADARGLFSLLTLKGVPYILALSMGSAILHHAMRRRRPLLQIALYGLNVLLVWVVAAAIALAMLG